MIKSTRNRYCDHVRILSARVENSGELGWVWLQFGRGEVGWERRRRRNRGRECRQIGGYIMVFPMESPTDYFHRWFHRRFRRWKCHITIRLSQFESLGNSVGKIVWRHHAVAYFQTNGMPRRRNGRYIPIDFETELCPSVKITVGNSVGFLRFSGSGLY